MVQLYPSLMAADLLNLEQEIKRIEPYCNGFHVDVMDFHFVPNMTWGPAMVNAIARVARKPLGIHLMVDNPAKYIDRLHVRDGDTISLHYKTIRSADLFRDIRAKGCKTSMALSPHVGTDVLFDWLQYIDDVLLMSVAPGFAGQKFIPESIEKLKKLVALQKASGNHFTITMDGGINESNIQELCQLGVNGICLGSAVFGKNDPVKALKELRQLC